MVPTKRIRRNAFSSHVENTFPPSNISIFCTHSRRPYVDSSIRESRALTNFIVVYFNWAFVLGLSPFRFVREPNNYYRIYKSKIQLVVSALFTFSFFVFTCSSSRINCSIHFYKHRTPLDYFYLISYVLLFFLSILITIHIWFCKSKFINIINFIQSDEFLLPNKATFLQSKLVIHLTCLVSMAMAFYEPVSKLLPTSLVAVDNTVWTTRTISLARYTFFMVNITEAYKLLDPGDISTLDYFLVVIYAVGWIQSNAMASLHSLLLLFPVVTVWMASSTFSANLKNDIRLGFYNSEISKWQSNNRYDPNPIISKWVTVYGAYDTMRKLCRHTNEGFGSLLAVYLASCIVVQAAGLDSAFITFDKMLKVKIVFVLLVSILIYVLAADACEKICQLKVWLSDDKNRENIPIDQLNIVLAELSSRDIGIRGYNVFTVTYNLLWNILTTIVTYFIICIQVRQQEFPRAYY